ncbi:MAG: hypothetical protein HYV02_08590 [Deltaproteobacteria bacterium]|nr:hypothetical protein [Deltaproteobacteria bacterium]
MRRDMGSEKLAALKESLEQHKQALQKEGKFDQAERLDYLIGELERVHTAIGKEAKATSIPEAVQLGLDPEKKDLAVLQGRFAKLWDYFDARVIEAAVKGGDDHLGGEVGLHRLITDNITTLLPMVDRSNARALIDDDPWYVDIYDAVAGIFRSTTEEEEVLAGDYETITTPVDVNLIGYLVLRLGDRALPEHQGAGDAPLQLVDQGDTKAYAVRFYDTLMNTGFYEALLLHFRGLQLKDNTTDGLKVAKMIEDVGRAVAENDQAALTIAGSILGSGIFVFLGIYQGMKQSLLNKQAMRRELQDLDMRIMEVRAERMTQKTDPVTGGSGEQQKPILVDRVGEVVRQGCDENRLQETDITPLREAIRDMVVTAMSGWSPALESEKRGVGKSTAQTLMYQVFGAAYRQLAAWETNPAGGLTTEMRAVHPELRPLVLEAALNNYYPIELNVGELKGKGTYIGVGAQTMGALVEGVAEVGWEYAARVLLMVDEAQNLTGMHTGAGNKVSSLNMLLAAMALPGTDPAKLLMALISTQEGMASVFEEIPDLVSRVRTTVLGNVTERRDVEQIIDTLIGGGRRQSREERILERHHHQVAQAGASSGVDEREQRLRREVRAELEQQTGHGAGENASLRDQWGQRSAVGRVTWILGSPFRVIRWVGRAATGRVIGSSDLERRLNDRRLDYGVERMMSIRRAQAEARTVGGALSVLHEALAPHGERFFARNLARTSLDLQGEKEGIRTALTNLVVAQIPGADEGTLRLIGKAIDQMNAEASLDPNSPLVQLLAEPGTDGITYERFLNAYREQQENITKNGATRALHIVNEMLSQKNSAPTAAPPGKRHAGARGEGPAPAARSRTLSPHEVLAAPVELSGGRRYSNLAIGVLQYAAERMASRAGETAADRSVIERRVSALLEAFENANPSPPTGGPFADAVAIARFANSRAGVDLFNGAQLRFETATGQCIVEWRDGQLLIDGAEWPAHDPDPNRGGGAPNSPTPAGGSSPAGGRRVSGRRTVDDSSTPPSGNGGAGNSASRTGEPHGSTAVGDVNLLDMPAAAPRSDAATGSYAPARPAIDTSAASLSLYTGLEAAAPSGKAPRTSRTPPPGSRAVGGLPRSQPDTAGALRTQRPGVVDGASAHAPHVPARAAVTTSAARRAAERAGK